MALLSLFGQVERSLLNIIMTRLFKSCHSTYIEVRDLLMAKPLPRDSSYWEKIQTSQFMLELEEKAKKEAGKKVTKKTK